MTDEPKKIIAEALLGLDADNGVETVTLHVQVRGETVSVEFPAAQLEELARIATKGVEEIVEKHNFVHAREAVKVISRANLDSVSMVFQFPSGLESESISLSAGMVSEMLDVLGEWLRGQSGTGMTRQ